MRFALLLLYFFSLFLFSSCNHTKPRIMFNNNALNAQPEDSEMTSLVPPASESERQPNVYYTFLRDKYTFLMTPITLVFSLTFPIIFSTVSRDPDVRDVQWYFSASIVITNSLGALCLGSTLFSYLYYEHLIVLNEEEYWLARVVSTILEPGFLFIVLWYSLIANLYYYMEYLGYNIIWVFYWVAAIVTVALIYYLYFCYHMRRLMLNATATRNPPPKRRFNNKNGR